MKRLLFFLTIIFFSFSSNAMTIEKGTKDVSLLKIMVAEEELEPPTRGL